MTVTFFIGNGFDIRIGIKSSYRDVEEHYYSLKGKPENIQNFQKDIKSNDKYWSNFELAMGKYTSKCDELGQQEYENRMEDFINELALYLQQESEKIDYALCTETIANEFQNSLKNFFSELKAKYQDEIKSILYLRENLEIHFVSFNYTTILDRCLEIAFPDQKSFNKHQNGATLFNHYVNTNVLHIHGSLPGPIIMGVDNAIQITNEKWAKNKRFRDRNVKPQLNSRYGSRADDNVKNLINQSAVICIFGMSLGETDQTWWKLIVKWLSNPNHRLIYFGHNKTSNNLTPTINRQFHFEDKIRDRIMQLAEAPEESRDSLEERILVVYNTGLFNTNLVRLTHKKIEESKIITSSNLVSLDSLSAEHQTELKKLEQLQKELSTIT